MVDWKKDFELNNTKNKDFELEIHHTNKNLKILRLYKGLMNMPVYIAQDLLTQICNLGSPVTHR
jgi:hypothetical protein